MCSLISKTIKVCVYPLCLTAVACNFASNFGVDFNVLQFHLP